MKQANGIFVIIIACAATLSGCASWDALTGRTAATTPATKKASVTATPQPANSAAAKPGAGGKSSSTGATAASEKPGAKVEALLDNILDGAKNVDYKVYSKDFTDSLKLAIPEKDFIADAPLQKNLDGDYERRVYMGQLKKGKRTYYFWKAKYSKTPDDVLIRLVIEKVDGDEKVSSLYIK